jgi:hypothetical protein
MQIPVREDGMEVLGGFVGTHEFEEEEIRKSFEGMRERVRRIRELIATIQSESYRQRNAEPMVQKLLKFIQFCLAPLPTFMMRTHHYSKTETEARLFDIELAKTVIQLMKSPPPLQDSNRLVTLSDAVELMDGGANFDADYLSLCFERIILRPGGIGMQSARLTAMQAYMGSIALSAPYIADVVSTFFPTGSPVTIRSAIATDDAEELFQSLFAQFHPNARSPFPILQANISRLKIQSQLTTVRQQHVCMKLNGFIINTTER